MPAGVDNVQDHVQSLHELQNARPVEARRIFRQGHYFKQGTGGLCRGYTQANIVGVHGTFAQDFAEFCRVNAGPLPLLQCYQPGVFSAPHLAEDSDIRTDLPAYDVLRDGEYTEIVKDLLEFGDALKEFAFAYTGCSFSFDKVLLDAGISLSYADNPDITCSMYTTNIPCAPVGPFRGPMVVSMRPIPRDMLEVVFNATHPLPDVHGAPMHIGNPASIGIQDLQHTDYGDPPSPLTEDQVPVFWGCGNTIKEVLQYSRLPLSFTMYSDCMYIGDIPTDKDTSSSDPSDKLQSDADKPVIVEVVIEPYWASVVSQRVLHKIQKLGQILNNTDSKDGIDRLLKTSLALSHSSSVALVITSRKDENDISGDMTGVVALARLLLDLGKTVTLIVDPGSFPSMVKTKDALVEKGILRESITLLQYPPVNTISSANAATSFLTEPDNVTAKYGHLMSLGSVEETDDVHQLFLAAKELGMTTTPDSGPRTDPCGTPGDMYGYAITIVLYWLRQCPIHDRYRRYGIGLSASKEYINKLRTALPSIEMEANIRKILTQQQIRSLPDDEGALEMRNRRISQMLDVLQE